MLTQALPLLLQYSELDMICVASPEGRFIELNQSWVTNLGYSLDQLKETPFLELVHEADRPSTIEQMRLLNEGKTVINFQNRYRHKEGHYVSLNWKAMLWPEKGLYVATAVNITNLLAPGGNIDYQAVLMTSRPIVRVDNSGIIKFVNSNFCEICGYSQDELKGNSISLLRSGHHDNDFYKNLWLTVTRGNTWQGEICNKAKDGHIFWVELIIVPLRNKENEVADFIAIYTDVTKLHLAIEQLERSEWLLTEAQASAKIGGWLLNLEDMVLLWTKQTYIIHEVDQGSEIDVKTAMNYYAKYDQPRIERYVQNAIENGEPYNDVFDFITAKGNKLKVRAAGQAVYKNGSISGLRGTFQDITEFYKTNEALAEERLKSIQAAKLAYLGQVSAGMAHEINNPLAIISGYSTAIQKFIKEGKNEKALDRLTKLDVAVERIEKIINNMRKFVRDQKDSEFERTNIQLVIADALEMCSANIANTGARVELNTKPIFILGNFVELVQVFVNLITNACHAIADLKEKTIHIYSEETDEKVNIYITDNGPGINLENQESIFEPFFTTKPSIKGTGLGLSIAKEILQMHEGSITYNAKHENTQFIITLPKV